MLLFRGPAFGHILPVILSAAKNPIKLYKASLIEILHFVQDDKAKVQDDKLH